VSNLTRWPGVRIRRRDLEEADVIERNGLRVTTQALTIIEAAVRRGGGPKLMVHAEPRCAGLHVHKSQGI